ncbi:MAG TPA: S8 family serine peptidase, partial [Chloroflexota bacterium]|nr:S8 family serine peptidase [Chloroflexota bacterium]
GNLGGGGGKVAVHEDDGISDANPFLHNASHAVIFWCSTVSAECPMGKFNVAPDDHASMVAGIAGSTHPLATGIAPELPQLLSANFQTFSTSGGFYAKSVEAMEWAIANGAAVINISWGDACAGEDFWTRYADHVVRNLGRTLVVSAGNSSWCQVGWPANAWNVITVGAISDNGNAFLEGDTMAGFSSFIDPAFSGAMKPEVVAPGVSVQSTDTTCCDWLSGGFGSGTSFAAPQVTGQVALAIARQPGQSGWPETNKAVVLASAYQNVAAGTQQDGVGQPIVTNSDSAYRNGQFRNDCGAGCVPLQAVDFPRSYVVPLTAGKRVRVGLAYDSVPTCTGSRLSTGCASDVRGADIDLRILKPDGTYLTGSFSIANTWELVEFTVPVSGNYTFRAELTGADAGWPGTFVGVAWALRNRPTYCTDVSPVSPVVGTTKAFQVDTLRYPTFYDMYPGYGALLNGRERVFKVVVPAGTTRNIKVTDTNASMDLVIFRTSTNACDETADTPTVLAAGFNLAQVKDAPEGTYYVAVDGYNGYVGTTAVTFSFPSALSGLDRDVTAAEAGR